MQKKISLVTYGCEIGNGQLRTDDNNEAGRENNYVPRPGPFAFGTWKRRFVDLFLNARMQELGTQILCSGYYYCKISSGCT